MVNFKGKPFNIRCKGFPPWRICFKCVTKHGSSNSPPECGFVMRLEKADS
uniref:Uncharacterized protein n=1 Tax=Arundo donax TaxID=35708 RepID=A0A0A9A518_ARUDO